MDFLPPLSALSVFLAIAGVGFLFLMVSLVFGEIFEHFGDGFDADMDHGGPGFFSTRGIAVFITAFGAFGAVGTIYGWSPMASSGLGFAGGMVFATAIYFLARFLFSQQSTSEVRAGDLVGQSARVIIGIPAGGVGQVRCRLGEELIDKIAQSRDGLAITENSLVRIDEVLGEMVIVKRS